MDEKYKILCINEIVEYGDYLNNGYTEKIYKTYNESPRGYYCYFKEILNKDMKGISLRKKMYIWKNYLKFKIKKSMDE